MQRLIARINHEISHTPVVDTAVQTMVDCKNVAFVVAAEKILEAKIINKLKPMRSIIKKVEDNKIDSAAMPKNLVVDFMYTAYIKKAEDIAGKDTTESNFADILYLALEDRYITKKKTKHKCQQFLLGLREYAENDERMDYFKKFIGFEQPKKHSPELLELYIRIMISTEESFTVILSDEVENLSLDIEKAHYKILEVFSKASELFKHEIVVSMVNESSLYCDGEAQPATEESQSIKRFILNKIRGMEEKPKDLKISNSRSHPGSIELGSVNNILSEIRKKDMSDESPQDKSEEDSSNISPHKKEIRIPIRKYINIGLKNAIQV